MEVLRYVTASGKDVFGGWVAGLRDARTAAKIMVRVDRFAAGNFGDCRPLRDGVQELKINWGAGYRVYYAMIGRGRVLLLCGGDKSDQPSDINRAVEHFRDYRRRTHKP